MCYSAEASFASQWRACGYQHSHLTAAQREIQHSAVFVPGDFRCSSIQ